MRGGIPIKSHITQMTLNMFSLTPLFSPSAFPFSYSTPAEPPPPDMPSILSLSSSSNSAIVFFRFAGAVSAFPGRVGSAWLDTWGVCFAWVSLWLLVAGGQGEAVLV